MITFSHINKSNCFSNSPFKIFHTAFIFKIRCKGWPVKAMQQLLQYPLIRYRFRQRHRPSLSLDNSTVRYLNLYNYIHIQY